MHKNIKVNYLLPRKKSKSKIDIYIFRLKKVLDLKEEALTDIRIKS